MVDSAETRKGDAVDRSGHRTLLLQAAQASLKASEERYRTIVTTADEGILTTDAEMVTTFANERLAAMLGYSVSEMIGMPAEQLVEKSAREGVRQGFARRRMGSRERREVELLRKDGSTVWTSVSLSPLLGPDGRFLGSLIMGTDITSRRQADEVRARLATIVESSEDAIFAKSLEGTILTWNAGACALYGYTSAEAIGRSVEMLIPPERRAELAEALARLKAGFSVAPLETVRRRKDGTDVVVALRISPTRDAEGNVTGAAAIARDVTERRRLEEERRLSEERFRMIFRASPAAIAIGSGGTILEANDRYCEFFGYARKEILGRSVQDLGLWVDPGERARMLAGIRERGSLRDFATKFRRKDGSIRDALMAVEVVELSREGEGAEPTLLIMVVDVTEKKRAEAELLESRSLLEQAQAVGHIGSWVSDTGEGGGLWWSEETKRIFGVESDEFVGNVETFFSLVHPDDLAAVRKANAEALLRGGPYAVEHRIIRPDGTVRVVREEAHVVSDGPGRPAKMVGVVQDVTERNRADERLRESEEQYRVLFDASPMPMWAYDPESLRIVRANQAAADQYGYSTDELMTLGLPDIRPAGVDAEGIREVNRALLPGRQQTGIWEHRRNDGSLLEVDVHLNDVELGGRRLKLAVLHDVTERRGLEEQLRQSQKMEAVGRLAGGVAHDFNNLLTAIIGYSDLLAERFRIGDPVRAEIQEIRRAGERAAALTRQLLAFSRKQVLVPEALDLGSVAHGLCRLLERLIGEQITVSVKVAPDLGRVMADPGQMEQVIMNLALNARDAMPRGGELLLEVRNVDLDEAYASAHFGAAPGPYVMLAVSDTGVGMSPQVQKQIFEPFFTTKPLGEGTGLGLATVYGIVNQSGGTIWVYSEVGRGTTFKVYLPLVAGVEEAARVTAEAPATLEGTETILLVEDADQLRRLARHVLELNHYTVLDSQSSAHAIEVARAHPGPIHLLLTDVVMPGMSGPEVAAELHRERPGVPVLFMSGYTDDAIVHHGVLTPGTHFLQKPFTPRTLARRVYETLHPAPSKASR